MAEMTELKQDMYNLAKEIYNLSKKHDDIYFTATKCEDSNHSWVVARLRGTEKYLDVTYWAEKEVE